MEVFGNTTQPHRSSAPNRLFRNDVKNENAEIGNRNKGLKKKILKIGHVAKCNKCQGYRHLAVDCTSPVKTIIVNWVLIVAPESGSIVPSKVTLVIKKISDIVQEDSSNKLPSICDTLHTIEFDSDEFTF